MQNIKSYLYITILLLNTFSSFGNNEDKGYKSHKDTLSALVITPKNPLYNNLSNLSGNEIMLFIDSILDLDEVPKGFLNGINDYAENKLLKHDYFISLTNYYENSPIPSNSTYGKWDTKRVAPYTDEITKNDTSFNLCH